MNVSRGSVEPASAAARHDRRQSSNCAGDASATVATMFFTELKAIRFRLNNQSRRKLQKIARITIQTGGNLACIPGVRVEPACRRSFRASLPYFTTAALEVAAHSND
jgi:hypothetical protein